MGLCFLRVLFGGGEVVNRACRSAVAAWSCLALFLLFIESGGLGVYVRGFLMMEDGVKRGNLGIGERDVTACHDILPAHRMHPAPTISMRRSRRRAVVMMTLLYAAGAVVFLTRERGDVGAHISAARPEPPVEPVVDIPMPFAGSYGSTPPVVIEMTSAVLADGLQGPDGCAISPYSGSIYFSEEEAARIVRLDPDGQSRVLIDAGTPIYESEGGRMVRGQPLRSPEGIALDRAGRLYVVEDIPDGRLIRFDMPAFAHLGSIIGESIPLPAPAPGYAWESIALGPRDELLLAGSNMEAFFSDRSIAYMFTGALLYRDANQQWWMPLHRPLDSFSGACFDSDGNNAFFISESMGYLGCIDLQTNVVRTWFTEQWMDSPEGVTCLPDGTAIVASENGTLWRVDPLDCRTSVFHEFDQDIESVVWDGARNRFLVVADGAGMLLSLDDVNFGAHLKVQGKVIFEETTHEIQIPEVCPDYLASLLELCQFDVARPEQPISFRQFVRNVKLFAMDADAELLPSSDPVADPLDKVQFVIFTPQLFGVDMGELMGPTSGFVARHDSGALDRTRLYPRNMMSFDMWEGKFTVFQRQKIPLPYPCATRLTPEGIVSVSFMGFGEAPDYHVIINMKDPSQAYMVAMHLDGTYQEYRLRIPDGKTVEHWIVGIESEGVDMWTRMNADPASHFDVATLPGGPALR